MTRDDSLFGGFLFDFLFRRIRLALYQSLARDLSAMTRFYDCLLHYRPRLHDTEVLFDAIQCRRKQVLGVEEFLPDLKREPRERTAVLVNGNFNHSFDIQGFLNEMRPSLSRNCRVIVIAYNSYLSPLFGFLTWAGIRKSPLPTTFLTMADIQNLAKLSEYEIVRSRNSGFFPWRLWGVGTLIEKVLTSIPVIRNLAYMQLLILRPVFDERNKFPSLTIVIPARNEKGNIENALSRMPDMKAQLEVIFVEGHSNDGTWEEILRVKEKYATSNLKIEAFKQIGKGKNDGVRLGFSKATGDLLTILDADLTMPPEDLPRFYDSYRRGLADFVNGSRLVYPMEGEAMRFLNRLGNMFFARALSFVLGSRLGDSLCGTKLLARHDYERFVQWREHFGDFDPFGDFELLFPASILGLGIVDVPIRYRARTYGVTNISRFRHGWMLLKMTTVGLLRVRLGNS